MKKKYKSVMIVAGETSGDIHGARLVNAMNINKDIIFFGIGGDELKNAGVKVIIDAKTLSVVGITEVFSKTRGILKGMKTAKMLLKDFRPDLLILIDFPEFNLHLAKTAKKINTPILYYVSPQIWAWRSKRVKKIKKLVDHMAVILPFEARFYQKHNVNVTFVGNPLLDHPIFPKYQPQSNELIIGLLPGSREGEVTRLLPVMAEAADIISGHFTNENLKFLLPVAPSITKDQIKNILNYISFKNNPNIVLIENNSKLVLQQSKMVIVASGTATLETALAEKPMVIIYKISPTSYYIGKLLINVENIGLANLVAGRRLVPELIQNEVTPDNIALETIKILDNKKLYNKIIKGLKHIRNILGGPGASQRTAKIARMLLNKS